MEERPIDAPPWKCPECHDLWEPRPLEPSNHAPRYTFFPEGSGYPGPTHAEWVRPGPAKQSLPMGSDISARRRLAQPCRRTHRAHVIHVRDAGTGDEAGIAQVYVASRRAAWAGFVDEAYLRELDVAEEGRDLRERLAPQDEGWRVLVAEEEARVLGFVTFVTEEAPREGHIGALFVSPGRFGSGIGTSLLDAATAALAQDGVDEAILWTLEEDRRVIDFYRRRGWEPDGGRQTVDLDRSRQAVRLRKPFS